MTTLTRDDPGFLKEPRPKTWPPMAAAALCLVMLTALVSASFVWLVHRGEPTRWSSTPVPIGSTWCWTEHDGSKATPFCAAGGSYVVKVLPTLTVTGNVWSQTCQHGECWTCVGEVEAVCAPGKHAPTGGPR